MVSKKNIAGRVNINDPIKHMKESEGKARIGWDEDFKKNTKNGKIKNKILFEYLKNDFDDEEWRY